ncbi:MAG: hypothetical protein K2I32_04615 [Alistipes sp.]|nr:hypothetical protein [Alistipes sp.]
MNLHLLLRALCAGLSAAVFSCAASRNTTRSTTDCSVVSQQVETNSSETAAHKAGECFVLRERTITQEPVAAREVALSVPLSALGSLPEGAEFSARQDNIAVAARQRGDSVIIVARSDCLPRTVMRTEYEEIRRQHDFSVCRIADRFARSKTDSLRQESRAETVVPRARARGCWRWFVAGAVVCLAVILGIRLRS